MAVDTRILDAAAGSSGEVAMLGEVVSWTMRGETSLEKLREAVAAVGLDAKEFVPDFRNSSVMTRIITKMKQEGKIVKPVSAAKDATSSSWQLNSPKRVQRCRVGAASAESPAEPVAEMDRYEYPQMGFFTMQKASGEITSDIPGLAEHLTAEMVKVRNIRTASDVTNMVQRIFKKRAAEHPDGDLFAVRENGGVYFLFISQAEFLTKIQTMLESINGTFNRFAVAETKASTVSTKEVVVRGTGNMFRDLRYKINSLTEKVRPTTLEAITKEIQAARFKVECRSSYMEIELERFKEEAAELDELLKKKVLEIISDSSAGDAEPDAEPDDGADTVAPDEVTEEAEAEAEVV